RGGCVVMSEVTRRKLLGTAAAATGGLLAAPLAGQAEAGQENAERKTLNYKFRLEALEPRGFPGGNTREAPARKFPISTGIASVYMRLSPGAIRELHWHANAAEWGLYLSGRSRVTIVSPDWQWETVIMEPGDVNYIPRGYAHYIQNVGPDEVHFILIFDS